MDVVIPLKQDSIWHDNELRHCLRSIERNFLDLGKIYLIGDRPSWVTRVFHIPFPDAYPNNKGANIISKLMEACRDPNISSDFLFVSDDQYMLQPMWPRDIKPYYVSDLRNQKLDPDQSFWMQCLFNMREAMLKDGLSCFNFEPHTPVIINKRKFWSIMLNYNWEEILYSTLSIYFNNIISKPEPMPDDYRARFNKEDIPLEIINGKKFLYHNDLGLSSELQKKIMELFPDKCRFEK